MSHSLEVCPDRLANMIRVVVQTVGITYQVFRRLDATFERDMMFTKRAL